MLIVLIMSQNNHSVKLFPSFRFLIIHAIVLIANKTACESSSVRGSLCHSSPARRSAGSYPFTTMSSQTRDCEVCGGRMWMGAYPLQLSIPSTPVAPQPMHPLPYILTPPPHPYPQPTHLSVPQPLPNQTPSLWPYILDYRSSVRRSITYPHPRSILLVTDSVSSSHSQQAEIEFGGFLHLIKC